MSMLHPLCLRMQQSLPCGCELLTQLNAQPAVYCLCTAHASHVGTVQHSCEHISACSVVFRLEGRGFPLLRLCMRMHPATRGIDGKGDGQAVKKTSARCHWW